MAILRGFGLLPQFFWSRLNCNLNKQKYICHNFNLNFPIFKKYFIQNYSSLNNKIIHSVEFDYDYLCSDENTEAIKDNIARRKSNGDIDKVISLWKLLKEKNYDPTQKEELEYQLYIESLKIPNKSSSHLYDYGEEPKLIKTYNTLPKFKFKPREFHQLVEFSNLLTYNKHFTNMTGTNAYAFSGDLADLNRALLRYTVSYLLQRGFVLISVPDLLYSHVVERCGMQTRGPTSNVFHLNNFENEDVCLSGTSEMAMGGYLQDRIIDIKDLPMKLVAVSRCYRDERGSGTMEKGIFRVPQFNKVEMFVVTANETGKESEELYQELVNIQIDLYSALDFHFKVLDMPLSDLGDQAYKKTDIEAWIPVQKMFGEISSATSCLDYQSRRLNIRYRNEAGEIKLTHTLNGTACATPRVLITMVASNQTKDGDILVPEALQPYFNYKHIIRKEKSFLNLNHFNNRTYTGEILRPNEELEADSV